MKLDDARINKKVKYIPYRGCPENMIEEGVITDVNSMYIFVRYGSDICSKATRAESLEYITVNGKYLIEECRR